MAVELATAFVSIVPDTSRIRPALARAFSSAERDAERSGERSGSRMADGVNRGLNAGGFRSIGVGISAQLGRGLRSSREPERAGSEQGHRYARAFASAARTGTRGIALSFGLISAAAGSIIRNVGTAATVLGVAARVTRGFAISLLGASTALRAISGAGLMRLAGVLRIVAAFASRVATQVARITSALLVLNAVAGVIGTMTRLARGMGMAVIGAGALLGVVSALTSVLGTAFIAPAVAGIVALGTAFGAAAGAAAGLLGPAMAVVKIGLKGMTDGAAEFNKQFKDSDILFNQMIGNRMGPLLTAIRSVKQEITGDFTKALSDPFVWLGGALDGLRPKLGGLATTLGNLGGEIAGTLNQSAANGMFDRMIGASDTFFQNFLGESGLAGVVGGLTQFATVAAETFAHFGFVANSALLNVGGFFRSITPEDLTGAFDKLFAVFETLQQVFSNVMGVARPLFEAFRQLGAESASSLAPGFRSVGEAIAQATPGLMEIARNIMPALGEVMTNLAPILPALVAAFTPWSQVLAVIAPHIATVVTLLAPFAPTLLLMATAVKAITIAMTLYNTAMLVGSNITKIWTGIQFAFNAVMAMNPVYLVVIAIAALVAAIVIAYKKSDTFRAIVQKCWEGIKSAVASAWNGFLKPVFTAFMGILKSIGEAALWLWNTAIVPAFNAIKTVIGLWWAGVQIYFNAVKTILFAIGDAAMWLWNSAIVPAFNGIKTVIGAWWTGVQIYFNAVKAAIGFVGDAAMWLWNAAILPAFNGIGSVISGVWNGVIRPTFDALKFALGAVGDFFSAVWNSIIKPAWDALGSGVSTVVNTVVLPAFEGLKTGLTSVRDFFSSVVESIKTAWNGLKAATASPINFVIEQVWNNGLVKAWNSVRGFLPMLPEAKTLEPVKFATGGHVSGPGTSTSDSIMARLSTGEHVLDAKDVRGLGGQRVVYALRNLIERGVPFTWDQAHGLAKLPSGALDAIGSAPRRVDGHNPEMGGFLHGILPGFDGGGEVRPAWEYQLENGHRAAKMRDGNPYTWGFEDCSGYMSMIADAILNGGDGTRKWATSSFPGGQPWAPGLGKGFSVGVNDDPGGPGGGHTSGTLTGVGDYNSTNVESGGSHGNVRYGGPAKGADDSQWDSARPGRFHLAIGADGAFESAGGPSREDQEGTVKKKVREIIDSLMNPVRDAMAGAIGSPPPELLGIPPRALDTTKDAAIDSAFAVVGGLGTALRTTWETAKRFTPLGGIVAGTSAVGGLVSDAVGLFRDQGGFIPNGLSIVRNETGKPEAVLNWDQLRLIESIMAKLGLTFPQAMKQAGMDPASEKAKAEAATSGPKGSETSAQTGGVAAEDRTATFQAEVAKIAENAFWEFFDTSGIFGVSVKQVWDHWSGPFKKSQADTVTASSSEVTPTGQTEQVYTPSADPSNEEMGVGKDWGVKQPEITVAPVAAGADKYASDIISAARDKGTGKKGAVTALATALVESGDPLKMWANNSVPESLNYPHDAVGSDHDSVGLFQQRDNGAWGTVAQRMNAYDSAGMFLDAMKRVGGWETMESGALAQAVQRSAFPGKYAGKLGRAEELFSQFGFAAGGRISGFGGPRGDRIPIWASNGEFMVNAEQTSKNLGVLRAINGGMDVRPVDGGASSGPSVIYNIQAGNTERAFNEAQRLEKKRAAIGLGRF